MQKRGRWILCEGVPVICPWQEYNNHTLTENLIKVNK